MFQEESDSSGRPSILCGSRQSLSISAEKFNVRTEGHMVTDDTSPRPTFRVAGVRMTVRGVSLMKVSKTRNESSDFDRNSKH